MRTMISLFRYNDNANLLVALLLIVSNYLDTCAGLPTEKTQISIDGDASRPEVQIPQGRLRGLNLFTRHERKIFGFKGIPFAKPPVGNLRFKGPLPPDKWNGTFDASKDSSPCPQMNGNRVIGDEDCLHINVYTPRLPANGNSTLLPVMLFIFGGKFKTGDNAPARWSPHFLLDKDVVLVVPRYRLGVLGFFSTGDEVSPGNNGLKDMVRALEWNRDNIRFFGGDPDQVTLFGGSAGAVSVELLTLSESTHGLFHRYITQSGSAFLHLAHQPRRDLTDRAILLGEYLGCPTKTSKLLVNCLRRFNTSTLIDTNSIFHVWNGFPINLWVPTIEPDIEGALLIDTPANLLAAGKIREVPWISSVVRDEGLISVLLFIQRPDLFEELLLNFDELLPYILEYDVAVDNVTAFTEALKSYYMNDLTADRTVLLANLTQLVSDAVFLYPAYSRAQQQLAFTESPLFLCSFDYRGTFSFSYYFTGGSAKNYGVTHGDEMIYLFGNEKKLFGPLEVEMNEADWKIVDTMVQLWTSFAITGTPTIVDPNSTVIWEPYSSRNNYLRIGSDSDTTIQVKDNFLKGRSEFWEELTAATIWK